MKDGNYRAKRDNIYVGELIHVDKLANFEGAESSYIYPTSKCSYRSILFTPTKDNLASDLLYDTKDCPILGITSDEKCLSIGSGLFVFNPVNISPLLRHFVFHNKVRLDDAKDIKSMFLTKYFGDWQHELFGCDKVKPEDFEFYDRDRLITDLKEIKKYIKKLSPLIDSPYIPRSLSSEGNDYYINMEGNFDKYAKTYIEGTTEDVLPSEILFSIMDRGSTKHKDMFKPTIKEQVKEGNVKKLVKKR